MNLGVRFQCFFVPLCIKAQSAVAGSGTEQEILRKTSKESEDVKRYCHIVEEYFHAFLNLFAVLSLRDHCAVIKKVGHHSLIEGLSGCNSGDWQ